jgi:hypothetical protein
MMSDPRLDSDPNRRIFPNRKSTGNGSMWIAAIVAILVIAGIAAYSYRDNMTASNNPSSTTTTTTTGQSTRTPGSPQSAAAPPVSMSPVTPATPADSPPQRP